MKQYKFKASAEDAARRLDVFIFECAGLDNLGLSRTAIQKLILDKKVRVNNEVVTKPHHKIKPEDEITISSPEKKPNGLAPENIPLEIVYEDKDLAVINKQPGLVTHPAPGNYEHTLVNALLYHFKELSDINPQRPGIVHRLDKETSGLLVVAKNNAAHLALAGQFAEHSIERRYIAVVKGEMEFNEYVIEAPIGRHPFKRKNMAVSFSENTRYARTHYRTLSRSKEFSIVELKPFTGRTHQLRVHLAFIGHPILGDTKYGKHNEFPRLALHAKTIGFIHPSTKKFVEFDSPIPEEFALLNRRLQQKKNKS